MAVTLDKFDKAILEELQQDASVSNLELSKKIGLSPSACLTRTRSLRESGVIQRFTTLIDDKKLGMEILAFAQVNLVSLKKEIMEAFLQEVQQIPQIQECYMTTGSHDFLLKIVERDMESYRRFIIDVLLANPSVRSMETSMVVGVEKRTTSIPIELG